MHTESESVAYSCFPYQRSPDRASVAQHLKKTKKTILNARHFPIHILQMFIPAPKIQHIRI